MIDAISSTHIAMLQDKLRLETINQNIANMQTPGYKRQMVENISFDNHLPVNNVNASRSIQTSTQHTTGTVINSKKPSDLALTADGFFEVQTNEGIFYTRRGDFHLNADGELVTATNAALLGYNGTIHVNDENFTINTAGELFIDNKKVDKLRIVKFESPNALTYLGQGLYTSELTPQPVSSETHVLQGYLEQSNVKSVNEMLELLQIARHFETSQRIMHTADSLLSTAINELGGSNI